MLLYLLLACCFSLASRSLIGLATMGLEAIAGTCFQQFILGILCNVGSPIISAWLLVGMAMRSRSRAVQGGRSVLAAKGRLRCFAFAFVSHSCCFSFASFACSGLSLVLSLVFLFLFFLCFFFLFPFFLFFKKLLFPFCFWSFLQGCSLLLVCLRFSLRNGPGWFCSRRKRLARPLAQVGLFCPDQGTLAYFSDERQNNTAVGNPRADSTGGAATKFRRESRRRPMMAPLHSPLHKRSRGAT